MCVREPVSLRASVVWLNAREAQQRVNERQTAATLAQRQFDRFQTLAGRRAISKAGNGYPAGQIQIPPTLRPGNRPRRAKSMTLTALFSGIAASVPIRNHRVVAAGQPIVKFDANRSARRGVPAFRRIFCTLLISAKAQYRPGGEKSTLCRDRRSPPNIKKTYR